jgi:putrescine aminotransferase
MDSEALYADVLDKYARHINPYLTKLMAFAGFGVEVRGDGCVITDHEGRQFIDCLGGYGTFTVGHRHPKVVEAVRRQLDDITLSGKAFFSKNMADLAEALAEVAPEGLEYSFFCNSGAEAVEGALKFAKAASRRYKIVSTVGSFHGKTLGALSVTGREKYRKPFEPLLPGVSFVPYGDADASVAAIDDDTACIIVEAVQGEGGILVPPCGYLRAIREACDMHGTILILDEVQTGFGRTGKMWGCDYDGVRPDLMTLAKALGGGVMPIGALMGTKEIWEKVYSQNPLSHTSTFGGNPIACAAGIAGLKVILEDGLVERSRVLGAAMLAGFQEIVARHSELVKEVRGRGLMIGLEFRMDEVGELVVAQLLKRGVCVAYALNNPRVLRFEPPLIISEAQIQLVLTAVDEALEETGELLDELA